VVDGTTQSDHFRRLAIGGVVFIEGNRDSQLEALERTLDTRRWAKAHYRPADRSKGYTVYMMEAIWFERLWFAAVRLREYIRDVLGILHGIPLGKKVKI
jgi:N-glycosylase/DNA lyase